MSGHKPHFLLLFFLSLWLDASLSGCAPAMQGVHVEPINGKQVEYAQAGQGRPVVVFENGLGGQLEWWHKVFPAIALDSTVFAYNRAGIGASAPSLSPRDGDHIIDELRRNLQSRQLAPPYILVGHSLGGLYMQLYARRYPQEVAGLVLVDSTHPEQLRGAGGREQWSLWTKIVVNSSLSTVAQQELNNLDATGRAMLALPAFSSQPVIILSATQAPSEGSAQAEDVNAKRRDIARLHPGAQQVWVDSGHAMPLEKPDAIIAAIRRVLIDARENAAHETSCTPAE